MKTVKIGIGIFVLGFIVTLFCASIFNSGNVEYSYYYGIIFSILYLCAVVGISTSLVIKELRTIKDK